MKVFLSIVLIAFFYIPACCQISVGIVGGLNLSHAKYVDAADEQLIKPYRKLKPGMMAGIFLNNDVNEVISVQAELLYSQKGLKSVQLPYNESINTMNYIELPISGHYTVSKNSLTEFTIYVGGYISYWLTGKYKSTDLNTGIIDVRKVDFNNPDYTFNRIDAGIVAGIQYRIKRTSLFLRYSHGMTGSSQVNADALMLRVLSFGINYSIFK